MKKYYRIFINQINIGLTYKWNIISGFFVQLLQIFTFLFIWRAIFLTEDSIGDYNLNTMTEYIIIVSILGVVFSSEHVFRMTQLVRNGGLSNILIKPYSYHLESFTIFLSKKILEIIILVCILLLLSIFGLVSLRLYSIDELLLLASNFLLLFFFASFLGNLSFWIIQMWPLKPLFNSMMAILGGVMFPLDLLPGSVEGVVKILPFSLFGYVNTQIIQGNFSHTEVKHYIFISITWIILFFILYITTWKLGLKKYESVNN